MELRTKNILLTIYFISIVVNGFSQRGSGFVLIPKGEYYVGKKNHLNNPLRKVTVDSFFICETEITNKQFDEFVTATSYQTDAERLHNALVFQPGLQEFKWMNDTTAYWRHPNGKSRGNIENKMN